MKLRSSLLLLILQSFAFAAFAQGKKIELQSPNGHIKLMLNIGESITYSVASQNELLMEANSLSLKLREKSLGNRPELSSVKKGSENQLIKPAVPLKYSSVANRYNWLRMNFKDDYSLEFRVFDEGVAYRFILSKKGPLEIMDEDFVVNFPEDYQLHLQQAGGFKTSYEEVYSHLASSEWKANGNKSTLPVLIDSKKQYKILISESDLSDYPCMFLKGTGGNGIEAVFPKTPLEFGEDGDRSQKILKEADYIAKTSGTRALPWRYFVIAREDKQLIENTMSLKLSAASEVKDPSWIKPGQASWEWWNDASPYGPDVNFVAGYNLETYKYYIDFAAKFGIEYIIMDEGWAKNTLDPYTPNPNVNVHELIRYGKEKNVGVILWLTWLTVHNNMDLFEKFSQWGVKGIKIDFMDRSDQWMVNFYERVAKEAAKNKLLVDFHGSFKPAGLENRYPNVISYEGVRGMEQMGYCQPDNSLYLPFMRNAVGPMDYTPGAMISMQPEFYSAKRPNAASIGTRAYQMALFVVFESGLQMLADNPTLYYNNPECTKFITQVPTTWDETRALEAELGKSVVVAKRKTDQWFLGGIVNGDQDIQEKTLKLDFLEKGRTYSMTLFEDGINAGRQAMDYRVKNIKVKAGDTLKVKMVRNGGFAAVIK